MLILLALCTLWHKAYEGAFGYAFLFARGRSNSFLKLRDVAQLSCNEGMCCMEVCTSSESVSHGNVIPGRGYRGGAGVVGKSKKCVQKYTTKGGAAEHGKKYSKDPKNEGDGFLPCGAGLKQTEYFFLPYFKKVFCFHA